LSGVPSLSDMENLSSRDWDELVAGEHQPFGGVGEEITWRSKDRYVGVHDNGRLLAAAGVVRAEIRVSAGEPFPVAGIGGVIVTQSARGRGLGRAVIEGALEIARRMELERAMLFCLPRNVALYDKFGFRALAEQARATQARGVIVVPMTAMWAPLRDGVSWPAGEPVEVLGEPF
jgi:predicted N-acetyltransferase YhbS